MREIAKTLSINLTIMDELMPSLLDSGSIVSLVQCNYFNCYFRPRMVPTERSDDEVNNLFHLTSANGGHTSLSRYTKPAFECFGS